MPYSYNPLIVAKLDKNKKYINDLEDVNTSGTVNGKVLTYQSGTWIPGVVAGVGDMLKAEYITGSGTVYNASRLEGDTLATVQAHNLAASKITTGTFAVARHETLNNLNGTVALAQVPTMDDAHVPDVETLSYGGTFATAQIPDLAASKTTTGTFNANRIPVLPTSRITSGTFGLARIPSLDNAHLTGDITSDKISALSGTAIAYPLNADSVGTTAIKASGVGNAELSGSGLDISKCTVGTAGAARIPSLPSSRITTGTFNLNRIPSVDDARIPDVETLSYGGTFATAQIPDLAASKTTTGTFNANRIPVLPTSRITSGTFGLARIPSLPTTRITTGTFDVNRVDTLANLKGTVTAAKVASLPASKTTTGTFAVARHETLNNLNGTVALAQVPTMDDAHVPDVETLSYGGTFATAQIPDLAASKTTTGTFNANRIPVLPTSRITSGTFGLARIPSLPTTRITTGTFDVNRVDTLANLKGTVTAAKVASLPASKTTTGTFAVARHETLNNLNGTVALAQVPTMDDAHVPDVETLSYGGTFATAQIPDLAASKTTTGTFNANRIPVLPTSRITSGTFGLARIPSLPTTRITTGTFDVNRVDTLANLKGTVTAAKVASLPASKTTTGTFAVARHETLNNLNGTVALAQVPTMDDAHVPDVETLSYGAALLTEAGDNILQEEGSYILSESEGTFVTGQIPYLAAAKITSGTFGLARIPTMDDAHIPNVEGLSYGGTFATAQIPSLAASKITTGTFNADRIPILPTSRITTGTFNLNRIPAMDDARIPDLETLSYGGTFATGQIPNLPTTKITSGTFGLARIPTMDDAHIPNVEGLSYGGTFATAQIPNLAANKITSGTFNANRIPSLPTARITSGTFGLARIPSIDNAHLTGDITSDKISALSGTAIAYPLNADSVGTTAIKASGVGNAELSGSGLDISKFTVGTAGLARIPSLPTARITSGTFVASRIPILPTDRYGSAVLLTGAQNVGGVKTFTSIPVLPASDPTANNEAARKSYVDGKIGGRGGYTAIVYKDGSMYIAKDSEGNLIIQNTDAATVVQKAIDDYAQEGFVLVVPPITLSSTLTILNWRSHVEFLGKITSTGVDAIELGDATHETSLSTLKFVELTGGNKTAHGIVVTNASRSRIFFSVIQLCDLGIYFNPSVNCVATDLQIEGAVMSNFGTAGVRFANVARTMEGNHFKTGIYNAPIGFDLVSGGNSKFQTFIGTIDCLDSANSEDIKDAVGYQLFLCDFVRRETCTIHKDTVLINAWGAKYGYPAIETRNAIADTVNIGFTPHLLWDFNRNSTGDWTKGNCTMSTPSKSVTRLTATSSDAYIARTISVDGGQAQMILIRYKWISGNSDYGSILYSTGGHGYSGSYKKTFDRYIRDGEWHVVALDMSELTAGGTDWIDNTITGFRFDFAETITNYVLDVDYIAIGGRGYGSIYHMDDALETPASASAVGNKGDIRWDASYIYICTATGTWKRVAISTW